MSSKNGHAPKTRAALPPSNRVPRKNSNLLIEQDTNLDRRYPCWNFQHMDLDYAGEWDWNLRDDERSQFFEFIKQMQALTWGQIKAMTAKGHHRNHDMETWKLCKDARDRLSDIGLGEQERIFRFRVERAVRIWGAFVGDNHEFYLIWWDRYHAVYPTDN